MTSSQYKHNTYSFILFFFYVIFIFYYVDQLYDVAETQVTCFSSFFKNIFSTSPPNHACVLAHFIMWRNYQSAVFEYSIEIKIRNQKPVTKLFENVQPYNIDMGKTLEEAALRCHLTWPSCTYNSSRRMHALGAQCTSGPVH